MAQLEQSHFPLVSVAYGCQFGLKAAVWRHSLTLLGSRSVTLPHLLFILSHYSLPATTVVSQGSRTLLKGAGKRHTPARYV